MLFCGDCSPFLVDIGETHCHAPRSTQMRWIASFEHPSSVYEPILGTFQFPGGRASTSRFPFLPRVMGEVARRAGGGNPVKLTRFLKCTPHPGFLDNPNKRSCNRITSLRNPPLPPQWQGLECSGSLTAAMTPRFSSSQNPAWLPAWLSLWPNQEVRRGERLRRSFFPVRVLPQT
jgi:hypothetical protein